MVTIQPCNLVPRGRGVQSGDPLDPAIDAGGYRRIVQSAAAAASTMMTPAVAVRIGTAAVADGVGPFAPSMARIIQEADAGRATRDLARHRMTTSAMAGGRSGRS